jgi:hypothetical protein
VALVRELFPIIRSHLDRPDRDAPTDVQLMHLLWGRIQAYANKERGANGRAMLSRALLSINAAETEYAVTADSFGTVESVTFDPAASETGAEGEVQVVDWVDLDRVASGYEVDPATGFSVQAIAFRRVNGQWQAKTVPLGASGDLVVYYVPQVTAVRSDDAPRIIESAHLTVLTLATALAAVPACRWARLDASEQMAHRREIENALARDLADARADFEYDIRRSTAEQTSTRGSFGAKRRRAMRWQ